MTLPTPVSGKEWFEFDRLGRIVLWKAGTKYGVQGWASASVLECGGAWQPLTLEPPPAALLAEIASYEQCSGGVAVVPVAGQAMNVATITCSSPTLNTFAQRLIVWDKSGKFVRSVDGAHVCATNDDRLLMGRKLASPGACGVSYESFEHSLVTGESSAPRCGLVPPAGSS